MRLTPHRIRGLRGLGNPRIRVREDEPDVQRRMLALDGEMLLPIGGQEAALRLDDDAVVEEDEIGGVPPRLRGRGVLDDELFVLVANVSGVEVSSDRLLETRPPPVFQGSGTDLRELLQRMPSRSASSSRKASSPSLPSAARSSNFA